MGGRGTAGHTRYQYRSTYRAHFAPFETVVSGGGWIAPQIEPIAVQVVEVPLPDASSPSETVAAVSLVDPTVSTEVVSLSSTSATPAVPVKTVPTSSTLSSNVTLVTPDSALGGAIYPFLEGTGRAWTVISSGLEDPAAYPRAGTFGMKQPTLRYVKDNKIEDVFVDGMTTEQFLAKTGLQLSMDKGGFVLSKRLSRIMRPYFASGSFPKESVTIQYLDQTETEQKIWDGAGLISRAMLERLTIPEGTPPAKRAELLREIAECKRVEFTVMTERGQDKGHAIVSDTLDADFVLPRDTKKEVKLVNGQTWVGVNFVHAHDEMRIDIQSLINLHPFFTEEQYAQWLDDEGKLFTHAVESGKVDAAMSRIDPFATLEDVEAWHLREYFASGGHALWSASVTRNLMNQHLKRLNETTLEKMRLPIPGGRYYVLPIGVGKAAGIQHVIPQNHVRIDPEYATAWVNDEDWRSMQDSPAGAGIRDILGGADNDDALWVHPFTDHDSKPKMLCWRSPNQAGEYIVLEPTVGSRVLAWETVDGEVTFPPNDSRKLFARTDTVQRNYLGLIDQTTASGLGKGKSYSVAVMDETIERATANSGGFGMYCNMLMLSKAVYGGLPKHPPAPLEAFIDSSVKTGADVSKGREWCQDASQQIIRARTPVPRLLVGRLAASRDEKATVPRTDDHWLDRLAATVKAHIEDFHEQRDRLVAKTMPPAKLFDHAFNPDEREYLQHGIALNKLYRRIRGKLLHSKRGGERLTEADMTTLRQSLDQFLNRFDEAEHSAIVRGALVATYMSDSPSDAALWMTGEKTDHGTLPGMAQKTMRALRGIGLLDEIGPTVSGDVIRYPGAVTSEPIYQRSIGLQGVWFNLYCQQQAEHGKPIPTNMSDVPKKAAIAAKAQVALLAQTELPDTTVTFKSTTYTNAHGQSVERLGAFTSSGSLLGFIAPDSKIAFAKDQTLTLRYALAADGNLRIVLT